MEGYPTQLAETVQRMPPEVPQALLGDHGLEVVHGLTVPLAEQLVERSREFDVAEYCIGDSTRRFKDIDAVAEWQKKGRLALPLVQSVGKSGLELMGMAWMGPGKPGEDEPQIPNAEITFALRLYEGATGKGNATPYSRAVVSAHKAIMGNNNGIWLEAWGDNTKATAAYARSGFRLIAKGEADRHGERKPRVYMVLDQLIS